MFHPLAKILISLPSPLFRRTVRRLMTRINTLHPELTERLTPLEGKTILLIITDMPSALIISIKGGSLNADILKREPNPHTDVQIRAKLQDAIAIFCGEFDGDELFFSKRFVFEGQTETIVHLRNAFDGIDMRVTDALPPFMRKMIGYQGAQFRPLSSAVKNILGNRHSAPDASHRTALQCVSVLEQKVLQMERRLSKVEQQNQQL